MVGSLSLVSKVLLSVLDVQLTERCFGQFTPKEVINFMVMNCILIHLLNAHDGVQAHPKLRSVKSNLLLLPFPKEIVVDLPSPHLTIR